MSSELSPSKQMRKIREDLERNLQRWETHEGSCTLCAKVLSTRPRLLHRMCSDGRELYDSMESSYRRFHSELTEFCSVVDNVEDLTSRYTWNMGVRW